MIQQTCWVCRVCGELEFYQQNVLCLAVLHRKQCRKVLFEILLTSTMHVSFKVPTMVNSCEKPVYLRVKSKLTFVVANAIIFQYLSISSWRCVRRSSTGALANYIFRRMINKLMGILWENEWTRTRLDCRWDESVLLWTVFGGDRTAIRSRTKQPTKWIPMKSIDRDHKYSFCATD